MTVNMNPKRNMPSLRESGTNCFRCCWPLPRPRASIPPRDRKWPERLPSACQRHQLELSVETFDIARIS